MSEFHLKDKHIIFKDGFMSTCPFTPALAIPRIDRNPNKKEAPGLVPFDKTRFPCSVTCRLLELDKDSAGVTKMRTRCIPNAPWDVLIIDTEEKEVKAKEADPPDESKVRQLKTEKP